MTQQVKEVNDIFVFWNDLPFTRLTLFNQKKDNLELEFIVNVEHSNIVNNFLKEIRDITLNKYPAGSLSFIGFGHREYHTSQYKKFRVQFIDSSIPLPADFEERLKIYVEEIKQTIKKFNYVR